MSQPDTPTEAREHVWESPIPWTCTICKVAWNEFAVKSSCPGKPAEPPVATAERDGAAKHCPHDSQSGTRHNMECGDCGAMGHNGVWWDDVPESVKQCAASLERHIEEWVAEARKEGAEHALKELRGQIKAMMPGPSGKGYSTPQDAEDEAFDSVLELIDERLGGGK